MLKTINVRRLSAAAQRDLMTRWLFDPEPHTNGEVVEYPDDVERPRTRGDCLQGGINEARPCPFSACRHHLYMDINPKNGAIKINHPAHEVWDMGETCSLDVADRAQGKGVSLGVLAEAMGLSYDRAFQLTDEIKKKVRKVARELTQDEE
jgi:hypothetical protein